MREKLLCSHCKTKFPWADYQAHVVGCIYWKMCFWDAEAYSKNYYEQVRRLSRFRQPGEKKRRSLFRSWGWWLKPDGLPIQSTVGTPKEER